MTAAPLHDIQGRIQDIGEVCVPAAWREQHPAVPRAGQVRVFDAVWDNEREGVVRESW